MANMLFANNCNTTLNGGITAVATSMVVTSATGFPVPTGSQYFYCTLADAATQTTIEIVKVTAVSGTTFTIVRGQDGTTGTIFASGAVVSLRLVRASLQDFPLLDETNTFTQAQTFSALTSGRVPYSSTGGLQTDSANLTFDGSSLTVSNIVSATTFSASGALYSNNGTTAARIIASGAASYWGNTSNHPVYFQTNNAIVATLFASGGVSIGNTTDPGATNLSVTGSASAASFIPTSSTVPSNGVYLPATNSVGIATNSALKATFDATGNLGFGTAASAWFASWQAIQTSGTKSSIVLSGSLGSYITTNFYLNTSAQYVYLNTAAATMYQQSGGAHYWYVAPSGTAGNTFSFTTAMYVSNAGGVSIGNTTDAGATNLSVTGSITGGSLSGPHNGTVGATTPSTGAFTTLSASSTVSGTGFSTYLASPPAIGGTAAAAGSFTSLTATSVGAAGVLAKSGGLTSVTAVAGSLTLATGGVTLASQTMAATTTWRIRAYGTYVASSSATARTLTMRCYWNTTALTAVTTGNVLASTAQTTPWQVELEITGSSATAAWCTAVLMSQVTSATIPQQYVATAASVTGLTNPQTLDFRVGQTGTAVAGDTINVHSVTIERIV